MTSRGVLVLMATFTPALADAASFAGITDGIYLQICSTTLEQCGAPQGAVASNQPNWVIATPQYSVTTVVQPVPGGTMETLAADTQLVATLSPGDMHAYASSGASIVNGGSGVAAGRITRGYTSLSVTALDHLHFSSPTSGPGDDVTFDLTGILHSTIAAGQFVGCAQGDAAAWAGMVITAGLAGDSSFQFAPGTFYHTSCGLGSDLMTATQTFHATVGGPEFGIQTNFAITADAGLQDPASGSFRQTVDASNTGSIVITVRTPGVTLTSDSGYSYAAPVPEPASLLLMASGLAALGCLRRRRHAG